MRVVQNRVTLAERAAAGILPAQTNARTIEHQRTKGNAFGKGPVDWQCTLAHLRTARELAHHFRVDIEAFGHDGDLVRNLPDNFFADSRLDNLRAVEFLDRRWHVTHRLLLRDQLFCLRQRTFQTPHSLRQHLIQLGFVDHPFFD